MPRKGEAMMWFAAFWIVFMVGYGTGRLVSYVSEDTGLRSQGEAYELGRSDERQAGIDTHFAAKVIGAILVIAGVATVGLAWALRQ